MTPVIALCTDVSILDLLKASPAEVDRIFWHPLECILDPSRTALVEGLTHKQTEHWPYDADAHVSLVKCVNQQ